MELQNNLVLPSIQYRDCWRPYTVMCQGVCRFGNDEVLVPVIYETSKSQSHKHLTSREMTSNN